MKRFFLSLAIVGAILPYIYFSQYFITEGFNLAGFVSPLFASLPAAGFAVDLFIPHSFFGS